jgi:hypothetical protein
MFHGQGERTPDGQLRVRARRLAASYFFAFFAAGFFAGAFFGAAFALATGFAAFAAGFLAAAFTAGFLTATGFAAAFVFGADFFAAGFFAAGLAAGFATFLVAIGWLLSLVSVWLIFYQTIVLPSMADAHESRKTTPFLPSRQRRALAQSPARR